MVILKWKDRKIPRKQKPRKQIQGFVFFIIPPKREAAEAFRGWCERQKTLLGKSAYDPDKVLFKFISCRTTVLGKRQADKIYYPAGHEELLDRVKRLYEKQLGKAPECLSYKQ